MKRKRLNSMPMEGELGLAFLSRLQRAVKPIFCFYRMDKRFADKIPGNIVRRLKKIFVQFQTELLNFFRVFPHGSGNSFHSFPSLVMEKSDGKE